MTNCYINNETAILQASIRLERMKKALVKATDIIENGFESDRDKFLPEELEDYIFMCEAIGKEPRLEIEEYLNPNY